MRYLFLLLLAALPAGRCAAQTLVVSRGGAVCYAHDKLLLNLDSLRPVGSMLEVQNDLLPGTKYYSPVEYGEQVRPARRGSRLRRPNAIPLAGQVSRRCDLGEFEAPGLYQVRLSQPAEATLRSYYAYSAQAPATPVPSALRPASAAAARPLARTYTLLDSALRHARLDTLRKAWNDQLRKNWVAVLAEALPPELAACPRPCGAGYDFALVLGTDNPLALLVLDDGLASLDTCRRATTYAGRRLARSLATKLLPGLLGLLSDTTFSLLRNGRGRAVPLLADSQIDSCAQTLCSMLWAGPAGPAVAPGPKFAGPSVVQDAGFMRGELAQRGVEELAAAPAFELLPARRQFRQLKLVFRLRTARPGAGAGVLYNASTQRMLGQANRLTALAALPDSARLYLLAETCDLLFTLDTRRETLRAQAALTEPGGPARRQLGGAALWQSKRKAKALLLSDKLGGRVLVCDLRTAPAAATANPLRALPGAGMPGADVGNAANEGIAADARLGHCFLLKNQPGSAYGLLRRFKVGVNADSLPTSLTFEEELRLDFPPSVAGAGWRYTDLVYDERYRRLLAFKSTYSSRPGPDNSYVVEAIGLDKDNHFVPAQKPETLVNLSKLINAYAACYHTAIEGMALANGWLYLVAASPEPLAGACGQPAGQPALLLKWPLY
ncbi:hypothetical protein [Hymenobacter cheonanensis]|uniref:hypothetical protein n=1 Tax=Hymenobacter sp. CA2-7 TaxID=3063993 RepID=UPI002712C912|nr:hypothetical protein [Hymenobacter sp. CA2-7]MDO7887347.1 hypothetical protein [Hymenobacter sp. CA2-7]